VAEDSIMNKVLVFLKKVFSSFDAPLHVTLRRFKIVPILVLIFFIFLTWDMTVFYKGVALSLQEWQVAPIFAFLAVLVTAIKYCLDAIRMAEEKDEHDKE
jgi:hypothetical protein